MDSHSDKENFREFRDQTHFRVGAVGEPGGRLFYLELGDYSTKLHLKVEKEQAVALAGFLTKVMDDMPEVDVLAAKDESSEGFLRSDPTAIQPDFPVGEISVGIDVANQMLVVSLIELDVEAFNVPSEAELDIVDPLAEILGESANLAEIRIMIDQGQAKQFISQTETLVSNSRKPCSLCGQPEDPGGHQCPRLN